MTHAVSGNQRQAGRKKEVEREPETEKVQRVEGRDRQEQSITAHTKRIELTTNSFSGTTLWITMRYSNDTSRLIERVISEKPY